MDTRPERLSPTWLKRLAWLAALWLAGVVAMGFAAWLLRTVMSAVGLSSP